MDPIEALRAALDLHHAGRHEEARAGYRRVLALDPADPNALNLLGVLERVTGNPLAALTLIGRALRRAPALQAARQNLDNAVADAVNAANEAVKDVRPQEALALARAVRRAAPGEPFGLFVEGLALTVAGDLAGAAARLDPFPPPPGTEVLHAGTRRLLRSLERRQAEGPLLGTVVIPLHNMADMIERALDSVLVSIRHHRATAGFTPGRFRIAVVDDSSRDGGGAVVTDWARRQDEPGFDVVVLTNPRNLGAGAARNRGALMGAEGRLLWFLDADDYVFPDHIDFGIRMLDHVPDAGFARTGMRFQDIDAGIPAAFRRNSEQTYPGNLCVRTQCHAFVGGFPEEEMYFPNMADDAAYSHWLKTFFLGVKVAVPTVHYTLRPGNALDIQRRSGLIEKGVPTETDALGYAVSMHIRHRTAALSARLGEPWDGPPRIADGQPRSVYLDGSRPPDGPPG
ncbi:glycosyltransferase [Azospirillum sp. RWY-5-1]|uniref:Glycosyltransferase n=1 Tax=Azospirillum oleiclasticum TaxID=2735135 RepID=A0ABX2TJU4_9PROT|nr:glycosyltransferase [Azospirillum oleiclasticum]NYZ17932.1 glycosyltransferase [Azospirillum oleiclasticum]NYZ24614.1 glycosyltransferase [Azospirillum oleiclasticum]